MRLASLLVLLSTGFAATVASSLVGRADGNTDLCGNVDSELKVPQPLKKNDFISVGKIDVCLCISDIPHFIATHPVAWKGVLLAGKDYVTKAISDMVNKVGKKCFYPDHASPVCKKDNPCAFECKDGYTPYPSYKPVKCVCSPPMKECNGKCGTFHGCPSGKPHYKRDSAVGSSACPVGLKQCGIWGRSARTWECVNTMEDLESCGGCVIPLSNDSSEPEGQDCTALPGVSDVSCIRGKCVVHRCLAGHKLHSDKNSCL